MKEIINSILDNNEFFEVHELFAPNIVVGYGRLNGKVVGIVANQPMHLAGALDVITSYSIHYTKLYEVIEEFGKHTDEEHGIDYSKEALMQFILRQKT